MTKKLSILLRDGVYHKLLLKNRLERENEMNLFNSFSPTSQEYQQQENLSFH
jgi:hypothetical protein